MSACNISYSVQNWGKYYPRSYHICRHIRNVQVLHLRAQFTQLTPTSSSAQADVWASCLEQKDHYKLCVWTMCLNSANLPQLHWVSAWPSLLDNASVLSTHCLISFSVCLRFAKHRQKVSCCLCLCTEAFSEVCSWLKKEFKTSVPSHVPACKPGPADTGCYLARSTHQSGFRSGQKAFTASSLSHEI